MVVAVHESRNREVAMLKPCLMWSMLLGVALTPDLWSQVPASFAPLVYEAEDYTTPKDAWQADKSSADHWNLWSTDSDAQKKWSGGVVLQSPVVKQDRVSPEEGAPPLHTRITGIPNGRYEVEIRIGRTLAVSRDGKTWKKYTAADGPLGVFDIADGTFELWVDDRYADESHVGSAYYDFVRFTPTLPHVDKPKVEGFARGRVREKLDRGLVATPTADARMYLSWRLLDSDPATVAFNVYRSIGGTDAQKLNPEPISTTTDFLDRTAPTGTECTYMVRAVTDGGEGQGSRRVRGTVSAGLPACTLFKLEPGQTVQKVGVGDLDGDGRYDYVLKTPQDNIDPAGSYWKPSPDSYKLDAYSADGRRLWRKDLGWAIERGIWYSPMIVHDLDGDGQAEVAVKTGEGDPRGPEGRVEKGPEFVSVLDGATGQELARADWLSREIPGEKYNYNLSSRNQICIAYLDGKTPCLLVARGTYTTIRLVAYQFHNRKLERLWTWDSREEAGRGRYNSQGAHIMHAADVDGDGRDEVIIGSAVVDDNGNGLWTTGFGHPDFCYVGDIDPSHPGLEIFYGIEPPRKDSALCLVEAINGKVLWALQEATTHVGTDGMCADIDARYPGSECHAADIDRDRKFKKGWIFSARGELVADKRDGTMSMPVYWDADPQRELVRGSKIVDYRGDAHPGQLVGRVVAIADVVGDWREELITSAPGELRIYSTTIPAVDRHVSLMQDPIYRSDVAIAFMGYYAAPMLSYDLGSQCRAGTSSAQGK
ncbi:MAG TPA: silent information regulator protein Sir2 [Verrucomicrobiae bacterium]|nr:silent information regulator protein Sir2 [Verrucomicrobiae bacterium]